MAFLPAPPREEMPPHKKEKQGGAAEKKELRLMLRAQCLERPSFHMWGVLQKKIKITGESTPGTVKPQTIWSFIVQAGENQNLIEKSPLQSITAACRSQNQGQERKDRGSHPRSWGGPTLSLCRPSPRTLQVLAGGGGGHWGRC